MKSRQLILLLSIAGIAPLAMAQQTDPKKPTQPTTQPTTQPARDSWLKPATPPRDADMRETGMNDHVKKLWDDASTPGEHHKQLEKLVGEWNGTSTMWRTPGSEPLISNTTCTSRMELDGRFLVSDHEGELMGMPFLGMGVMGYNNTTQKYESVWMDNMGTMTTFMTGTSSDDGRVLTMHSDFIDPLTSEHTSMKHVCTTIDENTHTIEMYGPARDGEEFMTMKIEYKRSDRPLRSNRPDRTLRPDGTTGDRPIDAGRPTDANKPRETGRPPTRDDE